MARRSGVSIFPFATQQQTLSDYVHALDLLDARIEQLKRALDEAAVNGPWAGLVARLRCLRGIDTLTALGIVCEIGDFSRFSTAEQFMAFVGLVPTEHSSGETTRRGSITKAGNSHVRRLLVEAAWHAHKRPKVSYELARRQRDQDPLVIERAWRCQQRLHKRWWRMTGRGKPSQKTVVACARELAGFIRAIAAEGRATPEKQLTDNHDQASRPGAADAPTHTENPRRHYAAPAGDPRR